MTEMFKHEEDNASETTVLIPNENATINGNADDRSIIKGSILIACSTLFVSTNDALFKYAQNYKNVSESQLLFGRYLIQLTIAVILWHLNAYFHNSSVLKRSPGMTWYGNMVNPNKNDVLVLWIRGFLYGIGGVLYTYSAIVLPLGDQQCIIYSSVCLTTFMGNIVLKEPLPKWKILVPTIVLCVIGVICLCQPPFLLYLFGADDDDAESLDTGGVIAAVIDSFVWSIVSILIRKAPNAHFLQIELVSSIQFAFFAIPLIMIINYVAWDNGTIGYVTQWQCTFVAIIAMIATGVIGFLVVSLITLGFQAGEVTKVSWVQYMTLPVAFIYQIAVFNDTPNKYEIIGAFITVIGCLLPLSPALYRWFKYGINGSQEMVTE